MKKVLILAYDFPPYVSVGGLRPHSWYKYLNDFGVYPIVVTRQWENRYGNELDYIAQGYSDSADIKRDSSGTVRHAPHFPTGANKLLLKFGETKFRKFRKAITAYYEFGQFLLPIGSKRSIYLEADQFLKTNRVHCIIATGDPFILFSYASRLAKKYSVPWIADYRDPWIQDDSLNNKRYKQYFAFLEKRLLKNAFKITTVSTFFSSLIAQNLKDKPIEILLNGFDPEILDVTANENQSEEILSIGFAGTIYDWHPIESFLKVCNTILEENGGIRLRIDFYGINKETELKAMLSKKYNLLDRHTSFYSKMSNLELAKAMANKNVCLLFNDYSIIGTKIFDYLAIKRRIIFCYSDDKESNKLKQEHYSVDETASKGLSPQADLINKTNSGIVIRDSIHLKKTILELIKELTENGFISCPSTNIENYSRLKQVERLAEIIKESASSN